MTKERPTEQQQSPSNDECDNLLFCQPRGLSRESFGLAWLFVSAFLFSLMGVFLQQAARVLPSTQLVCLRSLFQGSLVVAGMCSCRDQEQGYRLITRPLGATRCIQKVVLLRGAVGGVGFLLYYYTLRALPLGDAISLLSLKAVVTMILGRIVLQEPVTAVHVGVAVASAVGVTCIARPAFLFGHDDVKDKADINPMGYISALLGACCAAGVLVLIRKAGNVGAHTLQLLFSWAMFGCGLSILVGTTGLIEDTPWKWSNVPKHIWVSVFYMCLFGSAGHFLLNWAGKMAPAGPAAVLQSSDIAWAFVWEMLIFHQHPSSWTIFGTALIAVAIWVVAVTKATDTMTPARCNDEQNVELFNDTNKGYAKVSPTEENSMNMTEEELSLSDDDEERQ